MDRATGSTRLTWTNRNLLDVDNIYVYRSQNPIEEDNLPTPIATIEQNQEVFMDYGVNEGSEYYYRIGIEKDGTLLISNEILIVATTHWEGLELSVFSFGRNYGNSFGGGYGLFFSPDGDRMYVTGNSGSGHQNITQWNLSTPYDPSSANKTYEIDSNQYFTGTQYPSITFSPDGMFCFLPSYSSSDRRVLQINLSLPWDLSSMTQTFISREINGSGGNSGGIDISRDGYTLILSPRSSNIFEIKLNNPFDITSIYSTRVIPIGSSNWVSSVFDGSGRVLYLKPRDSTLFWMTDLSIPYDVSSHSGLRSRSISSGGSRNFALAFSDNGRTMWTAGGAGSSGDIVRFDSNQ